MKRLTKIEYVYAVVVSVFFVTSAFGAQKQQPVVPQAPVPSPILSSQTAFISYAGIDSHLIGTYIVDHTGAPNGLYDEFYAAMKAWGRYQLVSSPTDAELVFQIALTSQGPSQDPDFELKIWDQKTHVTLWAFLEKVPAGSGRQASRREAWDKALAKLIDDVKQIALPHNSN